MEDSRSRRTFILIIIAALLLHLLGLLFLLAWQHHTQEHEKKFQEFMEEVRRQEAQKNQESPEWAEMKARASDFGTTVLFQDEPEFTPAAQAAQAPKAQEPQKEKAKTIEREEILSPEKVALADKESTQITEEHTTEEPAETETYSQAQIEQKIAGMVGSGKKEAAPKPPITLSTIAKGFLSTLDQGGKDSMSMHGTKGAHPSAEQLNYQRYMEKFGRCVSNSHNIHKDKLPHMQVRVPVSVSITLLRDGTLKDSYISLSSGIKAIDDYVLFIHRDASPGFPPVPSSIKDELLHFVSQGIVIIGQEQSPFSFSMR